MMTQYTSDIFHLLRKGKFICSNSPDADIKKLYNILEDENTFKKLYDYFHEIDYVLEQGNEYFYFSRIEKNTITQRKLEKVLEWIDIVDFFQNFNSSFDVGFRFSASEIDSEMKNNIGLKDKLSSIKLSAKNTKEKHTDLDKIKKIIEQLEKENFITLENEISGIYKVLTSFNYLKDIITIVNIPEDISNEIPK